MVALKVALLVVLACLMQGQSLPTSQKNESGFSVLFILSSNTSVRVGGNETEVARVELNVEAFGDNKAVDLQALTDAVNNKVANFQNMPHSDPSKLSDSSAVSLKDDLPLALNASAVITLTTGPQRPQDYLVLVDYNLWANMTAH